MQIQKKIIVIQYKRSLPSQAFKHGLQDRAACLPDAIEDVDEDEEEGDQ